MCEEEKLEIKRNGIFGENENVSLGTIFLLSFKSEGWCCTYNKRQIASI